MEKLTLKNTFLIFQGYFFKQAGYTQGRFDSTKLTPKAKVLVLSFFYRCINSSWKGGKKNKGRFFIAKVMKDCSQFPHFNKGHYCTSSAILWNKDDTCSIKHLEVETPGTEERVPIRVVKSPLKKHNPSLWKKNKRKLHVNSGKSQNKKSKPPCDDKCRLTCSEVFNEEKSKKIFDSYWELPSIQENRLFIVSQVKTFPKKEVVKENMTKM